MGSTETQHVGFIGLGAMGLPMASHLAANLPEETHVYVFDVVKDLLDQICQLHPDKVTACSSAKELTDLWKIIFTMLPEGKHVKSVYLSGPTSIISSDLFHKLLVDCSTIDAATSLEVKDRITTAYPSASFYDAPVSGGVVGAQKATIAFFFGCREDDANLPKLTQLLELMGKQIIPCGGPSLGLAAKLSNNYLSGIIAIATSEAYDMGMRSGLDPRTLYKVFNAGTAQNTVSDKFCPVPGVYAEAPSSRGYQNGFKVQLMRKDFGLAVELARRVGARNVLGEVGLDTYVKASEDQRCRDLDNRVVFRYLGGDEDWQRGID